MEEIAKELSSIGVTLNFIVFVLAGIVGCLLAK